VALTLPCSSGLGFNVMGTVIDKATLSRIAIKLGGAGTVALPFIISSYAAVPSAALSLLRNTPSACAATAAEIAHVQATFNHASWSYANLTIGSLLLKCADQRTKHLSISELRVQAEPPPLRLLV